MKTYALCPVSAKRVNEKVARLNAVFTVIVLLVFGYTDSLALLSLLAVDFIFRATDNAQFSLLGITSRNMVRFLAIKEHMINAGPKIFAARIGLAFTTSAIITYFLGMPVLSLVLAGILTLFSFMEGVFGLCVACLVYPYIYKLLYKKQ